MSIKTSKKDFLAALLLFTLGLIFLRLFACNQTLGLDEAEQIVFAQELMQGYPGQPPLYTWIQYFIFKVLGTNLFSLSLLKYFLFSSSIYLFYLINRFYFKNNALILCSTFSWMLIPSIGYDLLPHRTHVILALFASCLTWYWFIKPRQVAHWKWYFIFGFIISIGLLSKFNYLLFFIFFLFSAVTVPEYREIILNRFIFITIGTALLLSSPYWFWLYSNSSVGLNAAYKLKLPGKNPWTGILSLLEVTLYFASPFILIQLLFPNASRAKKRMFSDKIKFLFCGKLVDLFDSKGKFSIKKEIFQIKACSNNNTPQALLLKRYHWVLFPLLAIILLSIGIYNFKTHWVVPLFFLSPTFLFHILVQKAWDFKSVKSYLSLCILTQIVFLSVWVLRTPFLASFPLDKLIQGIQHEPQKIDSLASDSHWLLGSLMWRLPMQKGIFICSVNPIEFPNGNTLLVWQGEENKRFEQLATSEIKKIKFYKASANWTYLSQG